MPQKKERKKYEKGMKKVDDPIKDGWERENDKTGGNIE